MSKNDRTIDSFSEKIAIFVRGIDRGILEKLKDIKTYPNKKEREYNISEYIKFRKPIIIKILQMILDKEPDAIDNHKNDVKNWIKGQIKSGLSPLKGKDANVYILGKAPGEDTISNNQGLKSPIYFLNNNNSFWSLFSDTREIYKKIKEKDYNDVQDLQKTFCTDNKVILRDRVHIFFNLSSLDKCRVPIVYSNLEDIKGNDIKVIFLGSDIHFHDDIEMDSINLIDKENKYMLVEKDEKKKECKYKMIENSKGKENDENKSVDNLIKDLREGYIVKLIKNKKTINMMLCYDPSGSGLGNQPDKLLDEKLGWNRAKKFGLKIRNLNRLKEIQNNFKQGNKK